MVFELAVVLRSSIRRKSQQGDHVAALGAAGPPYQTAGSGHIGIQAASSIGKRLGACCEGAG
jgi:hypothetical protein